jgi:hypothetical protein
MKKLLLSTLLLLLTLSAFSQKTYEVDKYYAELGGYVIKLFNADGTDGLVVAMQDQGAANWCEASRLVNSNHAPAGAKFSDWRMPSIDELKIMYDVYKNRGNGAKLNGNSYWSSSLVAPSGSWRQDFSDGNAATSYMSNIRSLRVIRTF